MSSSFRYRPSDDDGETWGDEVVLIDPGWYGRLASNEHGDILALAFVYNSGTTGIGKITRRFQGGGDTSFSTGAYIQNNLAAVLEFEGETFDMAWDHSIGAWSLFAKLAGDSGLTRFFSTDNGDTWNEI